jgi:trk system potassium uptake protein TrkA
MTQKPKNFAILGMGRFGLSIVETLAQFDVNVLACDKNETALHEAMDYATHVVQADLIDEVSLKSLGLGNFDVVVVAMGEEFEISLVATMVAKESGVKTVIAKARNLRQKRILENVGADLVILPEREMGAKLARKLAGSNILDILEDTGLYTISEMKPLPGWLGKTVGHANIRKQHGYTVLAIRNGQKLTLPVTADHVITADDVLIVLSQNDPASSDGPFAADSSFL